MGPLAALNAAFVNIFNFSGRATRSEFWWFFLILSVVALFTVAMDALSIYTLVTTEGEAAVYGLSPFDLLTVWVSLLTAIPYLSLSIRRLHDAGFSGFWWFLSFVPFGALALLVLYCLPSENRHSSYGSAPVGGSDPTGKPLTVDAEKRAMQGYACLFEVDREPSPEMLAARKEEVSDYYRSRVLGRNPDTDTA